MAGAARVNDISRVERVRFMAVLSTGQRYELKTLVLPSARTSSTS